MGSPKGSNVLYRLIYGKQEKIFLSETTSYCPWFSIGNYNAKPLLTFLCDNLHIASKLLYLTTSL